MKDLQPLRETALSDGVLLTGSAHPELGRAVARLLGCQPGTLSVRRFPDGEVSVRVDESIRRRCVVVLQPTCPPVDAHLVELLAVGDACRRGAAQRLVAVVPYFGYARADRTHGGTEPVMASMVARLLEEAGFQQVVSVDIHSPALEGFFRVPLVNLPTVGLLADALEGELDPATVVVSPDLGRVGMATELGQRMGKRRRWLPGGTRRGGSRRRWHAMLGAGTEPGAADDGFRCSDAPGSGGGRWGRTRRWRSDGVRRGAFPP